MECLLGRDTIIIKPKRNERTRVFRKSKSLHGCIYSCDPLAPLSQWGNDGGMTQKRSLHETH